MNNGALFGRVAYRWKTKLYTDVTKVIASRNFSTLPQPDRNDIEINPSRSFPRLMNFPEIIWPSTLKTLKNWVLVQFMIRPYFDRDFYIRDFVFGAKHALQVISSKLVNGDFPSLNELVTNEVIEEVKPTIQKLSVAQRRQLEINKEDIYFSFPYEVGIIFDESQDKAQKRWVEITMVFHVLRGLAQMREQGDQIPWNMGLTISY